MVLYDSTLEPLMNVVFPRALLVLFLLLASALPAQAGPATQTLATSVDHTSWCCCPTRPTKTPPPGPACAASSSPPSRRSSIPGNCPGRALGADWNRFSPDQQARFVTAFGSLLQNTYLDKIESYTDEKVHYLSEQDLGEGKAEVATKVTGHGKEIPVTYRLLNRDGWKVYDVVIEGVSLVQNYRSQFGQILMNESPDALIAKIAAKRS